LDFAAQQRGIWTLFDRRERLPAVDCQKLRYRFSEVKVTIPLVDLGADCVATVPVHAPGQIYPSQE